MILPQRKITLPLPPLFSILLFLITFSIIPASVYAAALSSVSQIPWSSQVSIEGKQTTKFTTVTSFPANGKIVITYPNGFDVSQATFDSWSGFDGGMSVSVAGQVVTITRDNTGTSSSAGAKYVVLNNITNHSTAGVSYTVTVEIQDGSGTTIDTSTTSSSFSITDPSPVLSRAWPTIGGNNKRDNNSAYTGPTYATVANSVQNVGTGTLVLIGEDDTRVVFLSGGIVKKYSSNGTLLWTYQFDDSTDVVFNGAIGEDGIIYAATGNEGSPYDNPSGNKLHAILPSGTKLWGIAGGWAHHGGFTTITLDEISSYKYIWYYEQGGSLVARKKSDGSITHNVGGTPFGALHTGVALSNDKVFFSESSYDMSATTHKVYAYNTLTGSELWSRTGLHNTLGNSLVLNNDSSRVYIGDQNGDLRSLDSSDGTIKWTFTTVSNAELRTIPAVGKNNVIYFNDRVGRIYALRDSGDTYEELWRLDAQTAEFGYSRWEYMESTVLSELNSMLYLQGRSVLGVTTQGVWHWKYANAGRVSWSERSGVVVDSQGQLVTLANTGSRVDLLTLKNWTLSAGSSETYYQSGTTMTVTATSSMLKRDPLASDDNQVQAIMHNGDKVTLAYSTTDENGNSVWTGTWTVPAGTTEGSYTGTVEAAAYNVETDVNTNFASAPTGSNNTGITNTFTYTVDNTAPTGSVSINSGDTYTTTSDVTLTLSATDATSGVSQMMVNNGSDFTGASWESYAVTKSWTLSSTDGTKTAYVKFKDTAGNISEVYSDSIILDETAPTDEITINSDATYTKTHDVSLTINATDVLSGIYQMMISEDSAFTGASWETYATSKSWTLSLGDGTKTVYIKFKDTAGNISSSFSDSIILDTTVPITLLKLNNADFNSDITTWEVTSTKPPLSGTTDPNATVTITITPGTLTGTATADATGAWSWTPTTDISPGTYTVTVTSQDPAGNTRSLGFTLIVKGTTAAVTTLPNTGIPMALALLTILFFALSGWGTKLIFKLQNLLSSYKSK